MIRATRMAMTYAEAVAAVAARERFGMRPGLERTEAILSRLGHPERAFPVVHVAGTNGKGGTAAAIAAILQTAGLHVGLFTSPHLSSPTERVAIDGGPLPEPEFARVVAETLSAAAQVEEARPELGPATQFELYTAAGFLAFARAGVEAVVVEVGLGGRLDATNVVSPEVSVITPIGLDHTEVLGSTLVAIAGEKAAIIKPGAAAVIAPQATEAAMVIEERLRQVGTVDAVWVTEEPTASVAPSALTASEARSEGAAQTPTYGRWTVEVRETSWEGTTFTVKENRQGIELRIPLAGAHQGVNGAVAAAAVLAWTRRQGRLGKAGEPWSAIREGLERVQWPGRLETVAFAPRVVLDGAHNPSAARALARALQVLRPSRPLIIVYGTLAAKDWPAVLGEILPLSDGFVATRPRHPRSRPASPEELVGYVRASGLRLPSGWVAAHDPERAVEQALTLAGPQGTVLVCGSLYLVGDVRPLWRQEWKTYAKKMNQVERVGG